MADKPEAERLGNEIRSHTLERGICTTDGSPFLADAFDGDSLDCSSLLAYNTGFLPDAIAQSTRERIEERLGVSGWLYRSEKDKQEGEGAFILCSFWLIDPSAS